LPIIPMLPIQILFKNLLYDLGQTLIAWDNVDQEQIAKPVIWQKNKIKTFAFWNGLVSPFFDVAIFWLVGYGIWTYIPNNEKLFQTSWFIFCAIMQILAVYVMRTARIPFFQSKPSWQLLFSGGITIILLFILPMTYFGETIMSLKPLEFKLCVLLFLLNVFYCFIMQLVKIIYIKCYKEWI
jgi:Mg2+-importing ATPase